ncbi:MAG: hypothetical protein ABI871_01745 [Chthoniobacterales bacterium]
MDPYAKPGERETGEKRPRIQHLPPDVAAEKTRQEREIAKQRVAAQRRAIKKAARRHLKQELQSDLDETG